MTTDAIVAEHSSRPDTLTVLWAGEHLALIKTKAGKDYQSVYCPAQVRLVAHGYGNTGWPYTVMDNTVWTCDRRRERPEENRGCLTPTVITRLISEAESYEADVWPGILATRIAEMDAEAAARQAKQDKFVAEMAQATLNRDALDELLSAVMDGDAIAILQAAVAYRETLEAQEAA